MTSAPNTRSVPSVDAIPWIPTDRDNELVFRHPWEAKAFALIIHLYQQGHFTWVEWADQLADEITSAGTSFDGSKYYLCWLSAAERLISAKSICAPPELSEKKRELESNQSVAP